MKASDFAARPHTEVLNQTKELVDYNMAEFDTPMLEALEREGAGWAKDQVLAFGDKLGTREMLEAGRLANDFDPTLKTHDRFGNRVDEVEFHPAWHSLMSAAMEVGLHSLPWSSDRAGAHVARAGLSHLKHQVEQGTSCPLTMTFAVVPSLRMQKDVADEWVPRALQESYDPRNIPAEGKTGVLFGMAMTERQGGSDVRANTTRATPVGEPGPGKAYTLRGHKWFCSAPQCDAFLVLGQTQTGLSCFLLPRFLPDGSKNTGFRVNRLKPKLGNRSNASSEVEFHDAWARMVGEEGRGVATIIEMVRHTRLDCTLGGASLIRRCVAEALNHTAHRYAFGKLLIEQPLMQNVLADLCLESEAATALAFRLARSFDQSGDDLHEARFARIGTAVAKYFICKKESDVARETMECHGGNGFVEESPMPRLYRESPLNSIWEGSGNVQCLDVLRAVRRDPETLSCLFTELKAAVGSDDRYDRYVDDVIASASTFENIELRARRVVEDLAVGLQASILLRHGEPVVADAYVASRCDGQHGRWYGTLPPGIDYRHIIDRALPQL